MEERYNKEFLNKRFICAPEVGVASAIIYTLEKNGNIVYKSRYGTHETARYEIKTIIEAIDDGGWVFVEDDYETSICVKELNELKNLMK